MRLCLISTSWIMALLSRYSTCLMQLSWSIEGTHSALLSKVSDNNQWLLLPNFGFICCTARKWGEMNKFYFSIVKAFTLQQIHSGLNRLNDFRLPFASTPITVDNSDNRSMLEFTMSNYTLVSLLYWMDQNRNFDYEISKESINNTLMVRYLRTECGLNDICAGTLFPGKFW